MYDVHVVGMELKPLNGDQKAAEAAQDDAAVGETAAGADATVVVLDGKRKR